MNFEYIKEFYKIFNYLQTLLQFFTQQFSTARTQCGNVVACFSINGINKGQQVVLKCTAVHNKKIVLSHEQQLTASNAFTPLTQLTQFLLNKILFSTVKQFLNFLLIITELQSNFTTMLRRRKNTDNLLRKSTKKVKGGIKGYKADRSYKLIVQKEGTMIKCLIKVLAIQKFHQNAQMLILSRVQQNITILPLQIS